MAWCAASERSLSILPATSSIWLLWENTRSGPYSCGTAICVARRPRCFLVTTQSLSNFYLSCSCLRMWAIAFSVFPSFLGQALSSLLWSCFYLYSGAYFLISSSFLMQANSLSFVSSKVMKSGNPILTVWRAWNILLLFTLFPYL